MSSETLLIVTSGLAGLVIIAWSLLRGWHGWLALKTRELEAHRAPEDDGSTSGMARIEIADLKERIRKLEAIAAGVDL